MRSMTFLVNDSSIASGPAPAVSVTITENGDGTVSFSIASIGGTTGDLRGFFFDVANESRLGSLSVVPISPGFTEFQQGNDSIKDLGNGANMQGLLGSDGGYDAGVEIGSAGTGKDDYQSFSFTLKSSTGALTLDDFANVDIGVRLNSVGVAGGSRNGEAKLLEHTTSAIDARDDAGAVTEDAAVNQVTGNVFANDLNVQPAHLITDVNGSAGNVGGDIQGTYGTLRLNLDGSYTYTLDNSRAATQALAAGQQVIESFTYGAKSFDEPTSASSDSASILITITGAADNAAPVVTAAVAAGSVTELADGAPGESIQPHVASGTVDFTDANLTDTHSVTVAATGAGYLGSFTAAINNPATSDGAGQVTWNFQVLDSLVEHLGAGEQLTQSYILTLDDGHGGTASQPVTITITGANDAPVALSLTKGGEVTEDAVLDASGHIGFTDLDLTDSHTVSVTPAEAGYLGTFNAALTDPATGDGTGEVDWTFSVSNTALQHLGQGDSIGQSYQISIDDGHGGVLKQEKLAIRLIGANDAPEIVAGDTSGQVFEDGSRHDSGQLVATDVDQHSTLTWSAIGSGPNTLRADYRFLVDALTIKNGSVTFISDEFTNGNPPPAWPTIALGQTPPPGTPNPGYFTGGTFSEVGGRLIMDSSVGIPGPITPPGTPGVIVHSATLNTDAGADSTQGLKRGADFTVEARYDLVLPDAAAQNYGVRLTDGSNDIIDVNVRRMEDGSLAVVLRESDSSLNLPTIIDSFLLTPLAGDNQIVLRLGHTANTDFVTGSFDLLNGGAVKQSHTFTPAVAPDIFTGEAWTRAQLLSASVAELQNGVYGSLTVDADGKWHYALNNSGANVQQLAQGEHVTDTFTVKVTDEHGASDTQTVSIDVAGSNDAPVISAASTTFGNVTEDFLPTASGQISASDIDHGAVLHWSVSSAVQQPVTGVPGATQFFGYPVDYHFTVDELTVTRNGAMVFDDTFNDGIAPPSGSNFGGLPATYLTQGGFTESDGRLHLDGSLAVSQRGIDNPNLTVGQLLVLLTNNDANDLTRGLKSDDDFTVEAHYDLATPGAGQVYGITLIDNAGGGTPPDQLGDSNVSLLVRSDGAGNLLVQLNDYDVVNDDVTTLQAIAFAPQSGESQIVLRLVHDAENVGIVHAEFDLVGPGGMRTFAFTQTAQIFGTDTPGYAGDDENWTRVQLVAFGPDTAGDNLQGNYGTLSVQQNGQWTYALDPLTSQSLAQNQFAQEIFSVRATDEFGVSSFRPVFVNVSGSNDPVSISGGKIDGQVEEDGKLSDSGSVTFADPDLIDIHSATFSFVGSSVGGFMPLGSFSLAPVTESATTVDGSVGWTYVLDNSLAQYLAAGQVVTETYQVTIQEPFGFPGLPGVPGIPGVPGFGASELVTITIVGAGEANQGPVAFPATFFTLEDVVQLNGALSASDPDGGALTFSLASLPQHGVAVVLTDGTFRYTPVQDYGGPDRFEFRVSDSGGSESIAPVTIQIQPIPDEPTLIVPGSVVTTENVPVALNISAALNDTDGSETLSISISGVFMGASLSAGTNIGAGIWHVTPDQLPGLMFNPAANSDEDVTLFVQALSTESSTFEQASAFGSIAITVDPATGTPPEITGETTGLVYEDAARVARGALTALDPDAGSTVTWSVNSPSGLGSATIDAGGHWTYTLNDTLFQVQQLAQGQVTSDSFTVKATDNQGASDDQQVQIQVIGTNDRPFVNSPTVNATVSEDAAPLTGQATAFDADSGAQLTWSLSRGASFGYSANYQFNMDRFSINKNGVTIFDDGFDAGGPPPSAPNFSNNTPVTYQANGLYSEAGGKLVLAGFGAIGFSGAGFNGLIVGESALLNTDTNAGNTAAGLKINHDFIIEGVFDLAQPDEFREGYGLQLADSLQGNPGVGLLGDDQLGLVVRKSNLTGELQVQLLDSNNATDVAVVTGVALQPGGADQIRLLMAHDADSPGLVIATFEYLTGGIVTGGGTVGSAHIFGTDTPGYAGDDESWTRAGLQAFGLDEFAGVTTLAGNYGTLTINPAGQWSYTVTNQSLAQGQSAVDSFHLRVTDQYGLSNSQPLNVTVTGANDAPLASNDSVGNGVTEDAPTTIAVLANDHDVDTGDTLHVAGLGSSAGNAVSALGASLMVNPDGTVQYDPRTSALLQSLHTGESLTDTFVYTALDQNGASSSANVSVVVQGVDDAPVVAADGVVFEDGSRHDNGQLVLESSEHVVGVSGSGVGTLRADYRFLLDNLSISRAGLPTISDDFGNGAPPPAGTPFQPNVPSISYGTSGVFAEGNGRLIMDGGVGAVSATPPPPGIAGVIVNLATLNTDRGPDASEGLKRSQQFTVEARYDLVLPDEVLETYGLRLNDFADDNIEIGVRRIDSSTVAVVLRESDTPGAVLTTIGQATLLTAPPGSQIALRLTHSADADFVTGSFDVYNGIGPTAPIIQSGIFFTAPDIFTGENWTQPQIIGFGPATPQNGVYGTLSVGADGEWSYALANSAPNVQALAQGEHATDTFNVSVSDGLGGQSTKTISIDVVGSDDVPTNVSAPLSPITGAYVVEDGVHQTVTGVAVGSDVDHGAALQWSVTRNTAPLGTTPTAYQANYVIKLDDLSITKNGAAFFNDNFNDDIAPTAFVGGAPSGFSYLANGVFSETNGRAVLDGAAAGSQRGVAIDSLVAGHGLTVGSNIDPSDLARGLKSDDDFTVTARFDLSLPSENGQAYGVSLTDNTTAGLPPDQLGDDLVAVELVRDFSGNTRVRFVERDVSTDTVRELGSTAFSALTGEDQIVFQLAHSLADVGAVHASFEVFNHGALSRHVELAGTGHIFGTDTPGYAGDDEDWTRVQILAVSPDTGGTSVHGTYGTLGIDATTGAWTYTLDNTSPAVQGLAHGFATSDAFNVRVTDEYGVSTSRPYNFTVVGTGDPLPTGPIFLLGGLGNDILVGSSGTDTFVGTAGTDLMVGLDGADTFDYNNLSDGGDTISDFTPGVGGDRLDLHDLLLALGSFVPGSSNPADFVRVIAANNPDMGPSTFVMVDRDGAGGSADLLGVAILHGTTGVTYDSLLANGNLIV